MRFRETARTVGCLLALASTAACARARASATATSTASSGACCLEQGRRIAERHRVAGIDTRRFTHAQLWAAMAPALRSPAVRVTSIGNSIQGRALRALTIGGGPTTVLLWSQMHGDESTATMSLADLVAWFAAGDRDALRDLLTSRLTMVLVPMLNPDGAELFQRENALGVDVNRDARRLSTPEARALKALRDSLQPAFAFNLHDQNARTLGGRDGRQVAIALLAPAADEEKSYGPVRATARLVAARMRAVLEQEIPGRIARYDDAFNPRAFGDLIQQWGSSAVLIESGALPGDPEKQRLRRVNVIALLTALQAIATGGYRAADPQVYESLPVNDRAAVDLLVLGGSIVLPGTDPMRADLAMNHEDALRGGTLRVREVGDLSAVAALDTIDATGLFLHPAPTMLAGEGNARWLRINAPAHLFLRRGRDPSSALVREVVGAAR
jgi:Zinc carboxypeptidase